MLHKFTIQCDRRYYYLVEVHDTQPSLVAAVRELRGGIDPADEDARAVCLRYHAAGRNARGRKVKLGELGTLFFVRNDLGCGVLAHELAHAALYWARRTKLNPTKNSKVYSRCPEEKFAHVLQSLVEQTTVYAARAIASEVLRRPAA